MIHPALLLPACLLAIPLIGAAPPVQLPIQPGRWAQTVVITDVQGGPPGFAQMMRGHSTSVSTCITPQDAAAGPRAAIEHSGGNCRFTRYGFANGRIAGSMTCSTPASTTTTETSGSYTPVAMDIVGRSVTTGRMAMRVTTHVTGHRTGAC